MGLRVGTNVQSLAAQRNLGTNSMAQNRSLEKLASGARITRAADDAAGLAIAERMRSQIRSVRQDVRNANDGISMIQTAEGGMNEIANILVRFRELSIQAATDTISGIERSFINKEVEQLSEEIDRIAAVTEFNGRKLLGGGQEPIPKKDEDGNVVKDEKGEIVMEMPKQDILEIQVGLNNNPGQDRFSYDINKTQATLSHLGLRGISVTEKADAQENLVKVDAAIQKLAESRAEVGALQNRLQSSINNMQIYDENLSGARSRIYDVDVASETAELTKNNILSQTSTAVLSQANQNAKLALNLMGS